MPVCFRKWLIICICARTVTQHLTQPREGLEQHLLFPLSLSGPAFSILANEHIFLVFCVRRLVFFQFHSILSFCLQAFCITSRLKMFCIHPWYFLSPLSVKPLLHLSVTCSRRIVSQFCHGQSETTASLPLSSRLCEVAPASIVAPLLWSVALNARLQSTRCLQLASVGSQLTCGFNFHTLWTGGVDHSEVRVFVSASQQIELTLFECWIQNKIRKKTIFRLNLKCFAVNEIQLS